MSGAAETTFRWAWQLIDGLTSAGMSHVVLSPGSRSTPLTLAALRHPTLRSEMIVDERSAAFFALGLAKASRAPVGLVATSGSAVANWLPAVVEADLSRVPLILLTADRPPELHDCGANQTMDQIGLFSSHVRAFHPLPPAEGTGDWLARLARRAIAASRGPLPGPVHINVPLREPLVPTDCSLPAEGTPPPVALPSTPIADAQSLAAIEAIIASGPGAVICGPEDLGDAFRTEVARLSRRTNAPIFADLMSNLRFGGEAEGTVLGYPDSVARTAPKPAWLLRFGPMPVSKAIAEWITRCNGIPQIVVSGHPRVADPAATASHILHADPAALCANLHGTAAGSGWIDAFQAQDARASQAAHAGCADEQPFEGAVLRKTLHALAAATPVFLGNSLAVRSAEWFAGRRPTRLQFFGNRGVSGIDGNLSTAFGIAAMQGRAVAAVGDLAFLHDIGALVLGGRFTLVVLLLDNGGGGIFDHLAQANLPELEQGWIARQDFDAAAAARAFGMEYRRETGAAATAAAVREALEADRSCVIHVPIDRAHSLERIRAFQSNCIEGA